MADDGSIKYDYKVIDDCLVMMTNKAKEIESLTTDLSGDVKKIMVDWTGSTADSYNALANDLQNDLIANKDNLDNLNHQLDLAAERMRQQDKKGASNVQGS
jgi:WXG100 family type VII secretion target